MPRRTSRGSAGRVPDPPRSGRHRGRSADRGPGIGGRGLVGARARLPAVAVQPPRSHRRTARRAGLAGDLAPRPRPSRPRADPAGCPGRVGPRPLTVARACVRGAGGPGGHRGARSPRARAGVRRSWSHPAASAPVNDANVRLGVDYGRRPGLVVALSPEPSPEPFCGRSVVGIGHPETSSDHRTAQGTCLGGGVKAGAGGARRRRTVMRGTGVASCSR